MLSAVVPTVTALTVPSLRGYSSACPVLPARLVQMAAASPDSDEPRTIEVCEVTDDGLISECEVREFDKLSSEFGAHHFSSDPEADDELFFEMTTNDDERVHLTLDDWQKLCETEEVPEGLPEVTEDALQKALGPEHVSVSADESRLHLHFGTGRLGLGLVLPAVSASGVPFAAVQRPKARWMALFKEGSRPGQLRVSVNSKVLVQNVDVVAAREGGVPEAMPPHSLVFGSSLDELGALLSRATSFSCSIGGAMESVLLPLLSSLPECGPSPQPQPQHQP